jgi:hypothetical protein
VATNACNAVEMSRRNPGMDGHAPRLAPTLERAHQPTAAYRRQRFRAIQRLSLKFKRDGAVADHHLGIGEGCTKISLATLVSLRLTSGAEFGACTVRPPPKCR